MKFFYFIFFLKIFMEKNSVSKRNKQNNCNKAINDNETLLLTEKN